MLSRVKKLLTAAKVATVRFFKYPPSTIISSENIAYIPNMTVMLNRRSNLPDYRVITKVVNGGHFGRHLEFWRELQRDTCGLVVCCSTHIPGPILKNSACYQIFPGFGLYLSNALGLLYVIHSMGLGLSLIHI